MENYKLVLPGHLNHYGFLYGGNMLQWVDEYAWIAATFDFPHCRFVTIGMDKVEFKHSVQQGTILRFDINLIRQGNTSVTYQIDVYKCEVGQTNEVSVFSTNATFVSVDGDGNKKPIKQE